jgi:hypothetical protein
MANEMTGWIFAPAIVIVGSAQADSFNASSTRAITNVSALSGDYLLVMVGEASTAGQAYGVSTVVGASAGSLSQVATYDPAAGEGEYYIRSRAYAKALTGDITNDTITVTLTSTPGNNVACMVTAIVIRGQHATPVPTTATATYFNNANAAYRIPITAAYTGSILLASITNRNNPADVKTASSNSALLHSYVSNADHGCHVYRLTGTSTAGATTVGSDYDETSLAWGGLALEIRAA